MASPQPAPPNPNLKVKTQRFWRRVSDGLAVQQLWSQLVKDARSSYRLYSADLRERQEGQSRRQRAWYMTKALFWAIIEKLSPARRVLLLIGFILLIFSAGASYSDKAGEIHVFGFDMR